MSDSEKEKQNDLLRATMNRILAHPETWEQGQWHCGTSHCFFGHAELAMGVTPPSPTYHGEKAPNKLWTSEGAVAIALGLSPCQRMWVSHPLRTLPELYRFCVWQLEGRQTHQEDGRLAPAFDEAILAERHITPSKLQLL